MSNTPLRPPGTKMLPHAAFIFSLFFIFVAELTIILNEEVSLRSTQYRRGPTLTRVLCTNPLFFVSSGRLRYRQATAQSPYDCICALAFGRAREAREGETFQWPERLREAIGHLAAY